MTTLSRKLNLVSIIRPTCYAITLSSAAIAGASGSTLSATLSVIALTLILEASHRQPA